MTEKRFLEILRLPKKEVFASLPDKEYNSLSADQKQRINNYIKGWGGKRKGGGRKKIPAEQKTKNTTCVSITLHKNIIALIKEKYPQRGEFHRIARKWIESLVLNPNNKKN